MSTTPFDRLLGQVLKRVDRIKDDDRRANLKSMLQGQSGTKNIERLNEVNEAALAELHEQALCAGDIFPSMADALAFMKEVLFPVINKHFRLYKTPKMQGDEYAIICRDWICGHDQYQTYARDRDVIDRLLSIGLPASVLYWADDSAKSPRKLNVLSYWRQQPDTQASRLNTFEYVPGGPDIVGSAFNTFKDVSVPAMAGIDVSVFLNHLRDNLCNGNAAYYDYLIRWLAHLVQRPAERPMTGISIIGGQGTGKSIFTDFIARMLGGRRNANTTTSSKDTKSFNTAIGCKLFVVFDEATFSGDHEQSDFMKKLVTEAFVRIEPKGVDAYEIANFARCFITSNNLESSTPADLGARRWLIMECRNDLEQTVLRDLAIVIGNNGEEHPKAVKHFVNGFKQHLSQVDLQDFNPQQLPEQATGMRNKLNNSYKDDSVYAFMVDWLNAPQLTLYRFMTETVEGAREELEVPVTWKRMVLLSDLYAVYEDACKGAHSNAIGRSRIGQELAKHGIEVKAGTGNRRFAHLPPPSEVLATLRRSSRFDKLVNEEQEAIIKGWPGARSLLADQV